MGDHCSIKLGFNTLGVCLKGLFQDPNISQDEKSGGCMQLPYRGTENLPTPFPPILVNFYFNQETMAISHILC